MRTWQSYRLLKAALSFPYRHYCVSAIRNHTDTKSNRKTFPFILYDPHNEEQQTLLRKALTNKFTDDPRFQFFPRTAREKFYNMIAAQVRTMYRYEHLKYSTLLQNMNAENPLRCAGNPEAANNPFLHKVKKEPYLLYRFNRMLDSNGVWDTMDTNVLSGLIWECVSRRECIYYNDILKQLPDDVCTAIKSSFHDIRFLICRYPFTFEIVRRAHIRLTETIT